MDIKQLIRARQGTMRTTELAAKVNAALVGLGAEPLTYEAIRRWRTGIDRPGTEQAATALAQALDIDAAEVLDILGWSRSADLHEQVATLTERLDTLERHVAKLRRGTATDRIIDDAITEAVGRDPQSDAG